MTEHLSDAFTGDMLLEESLKINARLHRSPRIAG
jgi:hypothetical protein